MKSYDIIIIGGGFAGIIAGITAKENGIDNLLILERNNFLGGMLNQYNNFEYINQKDEEINIQKYIKKIEELKIEYKINTTVLNIDKNKNIIYTNKNEGVVQISSKSIIIATGSRERPRGTLNIPGFRPSGIYSAGAAMTLNNIDGHTIGKEIIILGSENIGLISAKYMTMNKANVKAIIEPLPFYRGSKKNIIECLNNINIPIKLSHTITKIHGKKRIEGVTIAKVDNNLQPMKDSEEYYSCDTLLVSVELIPENEIIKSTNIKINPITNGPIVNEHFHTSVRGIFSCGNSLHINDFIDFVYEEANTAGKAAAMYALNEEQNKNEKEIELKASNGIIYTVPSKIEYNNIDNDIKVYFKVDNVFENQSLNIYFDDKLIINKKNQEFTPGDIESITIDKNIINENNDAKVIELKIE